ncbi:PH domain-containing protein [Aestuariimicrobium soli]|uniref:PH domain-containing protein n=1 Tax=Aestuariimicrobium soli TaxID=2035834 RepID=UPI003EB728AD
MPAVSLAAGERRVFRSKPVLRTAVSLSVLLLAAAGFGWFMMDARVRAQFTWPQLATLIFFVVFMVALMLAIGLSKAVATAEGLVVRNVLATHRYAWDEVASVGIGEGDAWAYLTLSPSDQHPDGETAMLLAIQRAEGADVAQARVRELRELAAAHRVG